MRWLAVLIIFAMTASGEAGVTRVVIENKTVIDKDFGAAGQYELLTGHYDGELDPADRTNRIITDIQLAPRNARGRVEYSATFALAKPVDMSKASGVLFYDTPNRGNGRAVGDLDGHVHLISGWQGDLAPSRSNQAVRVPVARNADGSSITGPVLIRIVDPPAGAMSVPLRGGLEGSPRPEPVTLETSKAQLTRKRSDGDAGELVPPSDWSFGDCAQTPFPGRPDARRLCVKAGFDPAFAYELIYTAKDPLVLGIGFAAVRDLTAFLRYEPGTENAPNPLAGRIRWAIATGNSQSGNFLRSFVHLGFNAAQSSQSGRVVFDGLQPNIAARQVPLNVRFGLPGGTANLYEAGSDGVLWWSEHRDEARGRGISSLLTRCGKTKTCPKVVEIFGSAEFWGLRMSPNLVGFEADKDIPLPTNVRRYYLPGVTHGGGSGRFAVGRAPGCSLLINPNPSEPTLRAVTKAMVDWVTTGKEPPPSRYPSLADKQLVRPTAAEMGFPTIPGAPLPDGMLNPLLVYDFGSRMVYDDVSGIMDIVPPTIIARPPSLVPRVDADGNETSGVPSVQHRVPTGTFLGWNVRAEGFYKGQGCGLAGGFIPFAETKAQRLATGDPRASLEERYGTHAAYVDRVRIAAEKMAEEGFLLADDRERIIAEAENSSVLKAAPISHEARAAVPARVRR